jgi:uncharacterized protein (TIGR02466 family)
MKNYFNDLIFPTFLTSGEVENLNNIWILNECLQVRADDPNGLKRSNVDGWHSELYIGATSPHENLNKLCDEAVAFANTVFNSHLLQQKVSKVEWWVNINPENTYNAVHSHPKADLAVVYYVSVPPKSELVLLRNDGAMNLELFTKQPMSLRFRVQPEVGRMYAFPAHLLHYVQTNQTKDERISIAFNMTI